MNVFSFIIAVLESDLLLAMVLLHWKVVLKPSVRLIIIKLVLK